jgi:hypothetical protein
MREKRNADRFDGRGLRAWLTGAVHGPASVIDVSMGGVHLESMIPLKRGFRVAIELRCGDDTLCVRLAVVVHTDGRTAGMRFLDGAERAAPLAA